MYLHPDFWLKDDVLVLAGSTALLWNATRQGIRAQSEDTRIIQRAYLSVEPHGIHPMIDRPDNLVAHVAGVDLTAHRLADYFGRRAQRVEGDCRKLRQPPKGLA
jgi:hypothetical protein